MDVRRAGVLGSPIAHSLSPALHRAAYAQLGLDWQYDAYEVGEDELAGFMGRLDPSWAGLSLTMPLKERVIDLLDEVDHVAASVRAVNTVLPYGMGWRGTNTDVPGMVRSLREAGAGPDLRTATLLGTGATARSAVAALAELGVSSVTVCGRRPAATRSMVLLAEAFGLSAVAADLAPDLRAVEVDVMISTLPGDASAPWARVADRSSAALLDVSYHPWPTVLASAWGSAVVASGRDLLLWQAVEQVRLMTRREPDAVAMAAALPR